jgi:hypothetical protein
MTDAKYTSYVLVTADGVPVYTNGHKYSLRKGTGKWRVHTYPERDYYGIQAKAIFRSAAKELGQHVRWEPSTGVSDGSVDCPGCNARDSVIYELLAALRQGWIDLKSNKMKHLERIASEVTK